MRRLLTRQVLVATLLGLLVVGVIAYFWHQHVTHARHVKHPEEVARILALLPDIPETASPDEVIQFLGLPKEPTNCDSDRKGFDMGWDIAPGYRFGLSFRVVNKDGKWHTILTVAGFMVTHEPDSPSPRYGAVYPYRGHEGMVYE
jgi:hypothetical protein